MPALPLQASSGLAMFARTLKNPPHAWSQSNDRAIRVHAAQGLELE
jgi:hypothetical protein